MTIEARINYQLGKPEDKTKEAYNYSIESDLDRFIVSCGEAKKRILNKQMEADTEAAIETAIENAVNNLLSDL